jgi:hypothetical protein
MKRRRFIAGGLKERGWIDAETAKFESYWAGSSVMRIREIVPGLVASAPDIIIGNGTAVTGELHKATQTIPVVFNLTADPRWFETGFVRRRADIAVVQSWHGRFLLQIFRGATGGWAP